MSQRVKLFVIAALLIYPHVLFAGSASKLVARGNSNFKAGRYDEAINLYEKASVSAPESDIIYFNLGDAYFKKGDYEKARDNFEKAIDKTKDLELEAHAWYNLGNCAYKQAERQIDSDLRKALEYYRESVGFYMTALKKDPNLKNAGYNLEVARLKIKDLLDRIKKQEEQMKGLEKRISEIADSLLSLIKKEKEVVDLTGKAIADRSRGESIASDTKRKQENVVEGTRNVQAMIDSLFRDKKPPQFEMANSHLDSSTVKQYDAIGNLSKKRLVPAKEDEEGALSYLLKALQDISTGSGNQANQEKNQKGEGKQGKKAQEQKKQAQEKSSPQMDSRGARDETAKAILDEEKENRRKRQRAMAHGYKPVEKDW